MTEALKQTRKTGLAGTFALTLLTNMVIVWSHQRLLVFAAGFVLMCLLPGYLLARVLLSGRGSVDWLEVAVLTCGLGFTTLILGTLGLHYLPGPLKPVHFLALYDVIIILLLTVTISLRGSALMIGRSIRSRYLVLLTLILIAAFFRLANLGYSEFQGDEARALLMAAGAIRGEDGILFLHRKGPAEILIPTAFYALSGTTNELVARLPFALANIASLLSVYALACRLFPGRELVPVVALGLLAVDGYLVAFGRIVQYQSIVLLMTALTAWCAYVWFRRDYSALALVAALFLAVGTLAHYEAVLIAPFAIWLFAIKAWREGWTFARLYREAVGPLLVLAVIVGVFYVPFLLDPYFGNTLQYITEQRVGGARLYNNLADFFWRASFYSSTYYVAFLILALLAFLVYQVYVSVRPASMKIVVPGLFLGSILLASFFPRFFVMRGISWAFLPIFIPLGSLLISPRPTTELKATFIWFIVACFLTLFFMRKPKTHVYTMMPAWATLAGVAVSQAITVWRERADPSQRAMRTRGVALSLVGVALLGLFGYYTHIVFVRHTPNYLHEYPAAVPKLYPVLYDQAPEKGLFGFPHRAGWKVVGALFDQDVLQGSYSSNEEPLVTSWYTRQAAWCQDDADHAFITTIVQDAEPVSVKRVREKNNLLGRVWSDDQITLEIYSRWPVSAPQDYEVSALKQVFDDAAEPDVWLWALDDPLPEHRVNARLGQHTQLVGFDAPPQVSAGGRLPLYLYWRTSSPFDDRYHVFAHVEREGKQIWAQSDGSPGCGLAPTTTWESQRTIVDGHSLSVDPRTPPGDYPLLVGLYDPMTGDRLPALGRDVNAWGNAAHLGTVRVVAPNHAERTEEDGL